MPSSALCWKPSLEDRDEDQQQRHAIATYVTIIAGTDIMRPIARRWSNAVQDGGQESPPTQSQPSADPTTRPPVHCPPTARSSRASTHRDPALAIAKTKVAKEPQLVPEGITDETKGAENIRLILRNLTQLTNNRAQLRGLYGTAHGRDGQHRGLQLRHSRLAVASAVAFKDQRRAVATAVGND